MFKSGTEMQGCLYGPRSGKKDRTGLPASVDVAPHTSAYDFNCNSLSLVYVPQPTKTAALSIGRILIKLACCTSFSCTIKTLAFACSTYPLSRPPKLNSRAFVPVNLPPDLKTWGYDSILPKRSSPSLRWNLYLMVQRTSLLRAHFWYAPSLIYHLGFEPGNDALRDFTGRKDRSIRST